MVPNDERSVVLWFKRYRLKFVISLELFSALINRIGEVYMRIMLDSKG